MNASQIGSSTGSTPLTGTQSSPEVKRATLQAMLLKKALDTQQSQSDAMAREAEGKGTRLDIRV